MSAIQQTLLQMVIAHELFHAIQFAYIKFNEWPSWGAWTVESTPMSMHDRLSPAADIYSDTDSYLAYIRPMLTEPGASLLSRSYAAGLFWSYMCEQFSSQTNEPERGIDFIRDFWQRTEGKSPDSIKYLREVLAARAPGRSLEEVFLDFQIAALIRFRDQSLLSADQQKRYVFVDETPAGGGTRYDGVALNIIDFRSSLSDEFPLVSLDINPWAASFCQINILEPDKGCEAVGFWGRATGDIPVSWAIIRRRGNRVLDITRGAGPRMNMSFIHTNSNRVEQIDVVAVTRNSRTQVQYEVGRAPPAGEIREPSSNRVAVVGEFNERRRFQVRVHLTGPTSNVVDLQATNGLRGLNMRDVQLSLVSSANGTTYPAAIVSSSFINDEYWLTVEAPEVNEVDGQLYGLRLCLCTTTNGGCILTIDKPASVYYGPVQYNQMLVIDRSYSMHYPVSPNIPNIEAARIAARVFVNAAATNDRLGLVVFDGNNNESPCDDDAFIEFPLKRIQDDVTDNRPALVSTIDAISEMGFTSIGDGLRFGRDALLAGPIGPKDINSLLLLSDGRENEGDFWAVTNPACGNPPVRDSFNPTNGAGARIKVDTIAFGANADQGLLQRIAQYTRGTFYAVRNSNPTRPLPASRSIRSGGGTGGSSPSLDSLQVANRLAHVHRLAQEELRGQQRLFYRGYQLTNTLEHFSMPVYELDPGGVRGAVITFNWHRASAVQLELRDPAGQLITHGGDWEIYTTPTHTIYQHNGLMPAGNYTFSASANPSVQMIAMLSGRPERGVTFRADVSSPFRVIPNEKCYDAGRYMRGIPVDISATLSDHMGPIAGLRLEARIENPDGTVNRVSLYDDGLHDNGINGDGMYGGRYTRTPFYSLTPPADSTNAPGPGDWGSYNIEINASGLSGTGIPFERSATRFFHVFEFEPGDQSCPVDSDSDTIPDRWEEYYGLDPSDPADGNVDSDRDGLINKIEFLEGTLPFNPDTDSAGESDGSEKMGGRDPLHDQDDTMPAVIDYGIVTRTFHLPVHEPQPNTLIIHYPANPAYVFMELWRQDPGSTNWQLHATIDVHRQDPRGIYYDTGLTNNSTYSYYLVAQGHNGAMTPPTDVFTGVPMADPVPPSGAFVINQGDPFTTNRVVRLNFSVSPDATEVKIAENYLFTNASYQNLIEAMPFTLSAATNGAEAKRLYVMVRDAAGNESLVMEGMIRLNPVGDTDADGLEDAMEMMWFNTLSYSAIDDPDGDTISTADEQILGTNPARAESPARGVVNGLQSTGTNNQLVINFQGNLFRSTNVLGPWEQVPEAVTPHVEPATNSAGYFIAR